MLACLLLCLCPADLPEPLEGARVLIDDDFERSDGGSAKDAVGGGWSTNSKGRAKGNKQVWLGEGRIRIERHAEADHGVSVVHELGMRDGVVAVRARLTPQGDLGLNFADMNEKGVHAGHLFMVKIRPQKIELEDLKSARMRKDVRERRQAGDASPELKRLIDEHTVRVKGGPEPGEWHDIVATVSGETLTLSVDGVEVGSLTSPGVGHPTKGRLRIAVNKPVEIDRVLAWSTDE